MKSRLFRWLLVKTGMVEPMDFNMLIKDLIPEVIWKRGYDSWATEISGETIIIQKHRNKYMLIFNRITVSADIDSLDRAKDAAVDYYTSWILKHLDQKKINQEFKNDKD